MPERTQRRTYKSILGFFFGFLLFQGVFAAPLVVEANANDTVNGTFNPTSTSVTTSTNGTAPATTTAGESSFFSSVASCFADIPKCFLVPVFDAIAGMMGRLAGAAAGLFIWVVDPANISGPTGILNKGAVYDLWRFIRDFFNLFFILILLLSAFATIFQLESFSIRKIFLNILFAALIINFSFPITRFLIDLTNVPMYYFLNSILPGVSGGKAFMDSILGSSGIGAIVTQPASADVFQAFSGAVFMFLFAISLLVLGVLMLVRLVALTLLLVFSPLGFAASLLPGMQDLGRKWWAKFWNYAFFGPAAALILLVAIRFQNEIGKDGTFDSMVGVATNTSPGPVEASLMARVVFYTIPLILIWTAIGLANSFSIAGAGKVVGMGEGAARKVGSWAKKGSLGTMKFIAVKNPISKTAIGVGKGLKDRPFVTKAKQMWNSPSYFESGGKGLGKGKGWAAGVKSEKEKYHGKLVAEKVKKNKDDDVSDSDHIKNLDPKNSVDKVTREAAAISLAANKGIRDAKVLANAVAAVGNDRDTVLKIVESARSESFENMSQDENKKINEAFYKRNEKTGEIERDKTTGEGILDPKMKDAQEAYNSKLKKEGQLKIRVDYEISQKVKPGMDTTAIDAVKRETYDDLVRKMPSDDLAKQWSIHSNLETDESLRNYLKERVSKDVQFYQEAYKKMTQENREHWDAAGMFPGPEAEVKQTEAQKNKEIRAKVKEIKEKHSKK